MKDGLQDVQHVSSVKFIVTKYSCGQRSGSIRHQLFRALGVLRSPRLLRLFVLLSLFLWAFGFQRDHSVQASSQFPYSSVVMGPETTCGIRVNTELDCWGRGDEGQLGTDLQSSSTPRRIRINGDPLSGVQTVGVGVAHVCAVRSSEVLCWGRNDRGQLGDGSTISSLVPVAVAGLVEIIGAVSAVAVGARHSCATGLSGEIACWGDNRYWQLGNESFTDQYSTVPVQTYMSRSLSLLGETLPIDDARSISALSQATCAVVGSRGGVICWGRNNINNEGGSLGFTVSWSAFPSVMNTPTKVARPVQLPGSGDLVGITMISASRTHVCSVSETGDIYCWGLSYDSETGVDNSVVSPFRLTGITQARSVSSGRNHSCALLVNGSAKCWGGNVFGQLWNGFPSETNGPASIIDSKGAARNNVALVVAGDYSTCLVTSSQDFECSGKNTYGQFLEPGQDYSMGNVESFDMGQYFGCAVLISHQVHCWGHSNSYGTVGQGDRSGDYSDYVQTKPVVYEDGTVIGNAVTVTAGGNFACATLSTKRVACWGSNMYGQLGANQSSGNHFTAVVIQDGNGIPLTDVVQVDSGTVHACALKTSGEVSCWGWGEFGQTGSRSADYVSLGLGYYHSCAIGRDQRAHCWGRGDGYQLGNGLTQNASSQITIPNVRKISGSEQGGCLIQILGDVYCWGFNSYGQAGGLPDSPNTYDVAFPRKVVGIDNAIDISMGDYHTCIIRSDETTWCWGKGYQGQLGNGDPYGDPPTHSRIPIQAVNAPAALAVRTGKDTTCVLETSHHISCWGSAARSIHELGSGRSYDDFNSSSPSQLNPVRVLQALPPEISNVQLTNIDNATSKIHFSLEANLDITAVNYQVTDVASGNQIASIVLNRSFRGGSKQEIEFTIPRSDSSRKLSVAISAENSVGVDTRMVTIESIAIPTSDQESTYATDPPSVSISPSVPTCYTCQSLPNAALSPYSTLTTSSQATPLNPKPRPPLVMKKKRITAREVASYVNLTVASRSKLLVTVSKSTDSFCKVVHELVVGLKLGRWCVVRIAVQDSKGKTKSRSVRILVLK